MIKNKRRIQRSRPDWKNLSAYDYLNDTPARDLAWEFLRRNKNYYEDYKNHRDYPSRKKLMANKDNKDFFYNNFESDPPMNEGESYTNYKARINDQRKNFPNMPRYKYKAKFEKFLEKYDLAQHENIKKYRMKNQDGPSFNLPSDQYPIFSRLSKRGMRITPKENSKEELVVKLNVLFPLDDQITKVTEAFNRKKCEVLENPTKGKAPTDKNILITYLRLLDAQATGATDEEILFYLYRSTFPYSHEITSTNQIKERLCKMDGDEKQRIKKRMNDNKESAYKLRDGGYIALAKSVSLFLSQSQEESIFMK